MLVCYCGGDFTAGHHDTQTIHATVKEHICPKDSKDLEWILTERYHAKLNIFSSRENKMKHIWQGNQHSIEANEAIVAKTTNKED